MYNSLPLTRWPDFFNISVGTNFNQIDDVIKQQLIATYLLLKSIGSYAKSLRHDKLD